jgi:hypothetical protein
MEDSIKQLEYLRTKIERLLIVVIASAIGVGFFSLILFASIGMVQMIVIFPLLIGIGSGFLLGKLTGYFDAYKEYKHGFKAAFVEVPFRDSFTQVTYDGAKGFDQEIIGATGIMTMGNRYYSNDYVQGYYKDVRFERADIKIQQHVSTGKTSYTVTYLHGRWLILEFNKSFHSDLQIIHRDFPSSQKKNSIFTNEEERRHRIELEDMEFNELFRILCQDDHEAYYILTPHFMQVLKNLYATLDGSFMLGFVNHQLHIAIHNNKDAMEPKLFDNYDLGLIKEEVQKEIDVIIDIIDGLSLDRDIYQIKEEVK